MASGGSVTDRRIADARRERLAGTSDFAAERLYRICRVAGRFAGLLMLRAGSTGSAAQRLYRICRAAALPDLPRSGSTGSAAQRLYRICRAAALPDLPRSGAPGLAAWCMVLSMTSR